MKKYFLNLAALVIIYIANTSAHNSIWPNLDYITSEGKYFCTQFQFLDGSNRTAEFKNVFPTLFKNQVLKTNKTFSTTDFTNKELVKLLGKPTTGNGVTEFEYQLNPDVSNCIAKFTFNKETNALTCVVFNIN